MLYRNRDLFDMPAPVPPYPEPRVYRQIARQVCKLARDESRVELIVKETPAILDGSYKVTRMNCQRLSE